MNEESKGQTQAPEDMFKEECFLLRGSIETNKKRIMAHKQHPLVVDMVDGSGEVIANLQLAYRHLEDARMRIGKAIQAYDGGKSCYPR